MSDARAAAPGAGVGATAPMFRRLRRWAGGALPVAAVCGAILALWYAACVPMNIKETLTAAERAGVAVVPADPAERRAAGRIALAARNPVVWPATLSQERARLPAPHQVGAEMWDTIVGQPVTSRRSLVFHAWVTISATLLGFAIGAGLGLILAVGIVHSRAMDLSVMPWVIASQTIPILALAPMIIVVLASLGLTGLVPKAMISAYLSFFPVVVGMVKGFRAPATTDLDLLATYGASRVQVFRNLRLPTSMPYLFTSLKVAVAASLVGAIVGELPTGAVRGLGARLLAGSYYGQTEQIWAALFMAAICAAGLVALVGVVERAVLGRMGFGR